MSYKNQTKELKWGSLGMLLGTLEAGFSGNKLEELVVEIKKGKGIVISGYGNKMDF